MQFFETSEGVNDDSPNKTLLEVLLLLLELGYFVVEVAIVSELHHDAEEYNSYHRLLPYRKAYL